MKKLIFKERGQALIMIALAVVVLFGFAALAIDGSIMFSDRRHAQNAADTAALAAGLAYTRGNPYEKPAYDRATSNGYDNNGASNIVEVLATDTPKGRCKDKGKFITVKITSHVKTTFARILGWDQFTNVVDAVSIACEFVKGKPFYKDHAVWSTKFTSCGSGTQHKGLYVGGSSKLDLYGSGMGSSSADPNCIDLAGGLTTLNYNGTSCGSITTAASVDPNISKLTNNTSCADVVGPVEPEPNPGNQNISCGNTNATSSGDTMSPGNYGGKTFPPANITTLKPGIYCITAGDFTLNANHTLMAEGVTIVVEHGTVTVNGNAQTKLTAPTSGETKGLLFYLPPSNVSTVTMNGTGNVTFTGTVLAETSACDYSGTNNVNKQVLQFICSTWQASGNAELGLIYDPSVFYTPDTDGTVSMGG